MKTLSKNKILITLLALFMGLCSLMGIFMTVPHIASADSTSLKFIEDEETTKHLLCGGLYRIRKTDGTIFTGSEEDIIMSADGFTFLSVDISSGYLIHECGNSSCGQKSKVSKIVNTGDDLAYIDVSIPGQYRCVCGENSGIKEIHSLLGDLYEAHHLIPDVDLSSVTQFYSAEDSLYGGCWVKMDLDEFYQEADGSYYIDCKVTFIIEEGNATQFNTVLRIRVSDVFCVFVDTYAYLTNYDLTEMEPITKYAVMEDSVAFYLPESYLAFEINEKVVDAPIDGPSNNNGNETPDGDNSDDVVEEDKTFGDWINGIGDSISEWLGENTGVAVSSSAILVVGLIIIILALKKRR